MLLLLISVVVSQTEIDSEREGEQEQEQERKRARDLSFSGIVRTRMRTAAHNLAPVAGQQLGTPSRGLPETRFPRQLPSMATRWNSVATSHESASKLFVIFYQ